MERPPFRLPPILYCTARVNSISEGMVTVLLVSGLSLFRKVIHPFLSWRYPPNWRTWRFPTSNHHCYVILSIICFLQFITD